MLLMGETMLIKEIAIKQSELEYYRGHKDER